MIGLIVCKIASTQDIASSINLWLHNNHTFFLYIYTQRKCNFKVYRSSLSRIHFYSYISSVLSLTEISKGNLITSKPPSNHKSCMAFLRHLYYFWGNILIIIMAFISRIKLTLWPFIFVWSDGTSMQQCKNLGQPLNLVGSTMEDIDYIDQLLIWVDNEFLEK